MFNCSGVLFAVDDVDDVFCVVLLFGFDIFYFLLSGCLFVNVAFQLPFYLKT